MAWQAIYNDLNEVCVSLISDKNAIRRLVTLSGVPAGNINFGGAANDIWFAAITEADKQGKVLPLAMQIQKEYPNHVRLNSIISQLQGNAPLEPPPGQDNIPPVKPADPVKQDIPENIHPDGGKPVNIPPKQPGADTIPANADKPTKSTSEKVERWVKIVAAIIGIPIAVIGAYIKWDEYQMKKLENMSPAEEAPVQDSSYYDTDTISNRSADLEGSKD